MPEHVNCNLCGADDTRLLYSLRDYRLRVNDLLWNLVQCRRCSLGYLVRALEDSAAARVGDAGVDRLGKSDKLRHTVTVA